MTEQVFDDMERMLDFRPHAGLQMLQLFRHAAQFVVGQRLAFGAFHGDMPDHRFANIFGALLHALIAGVTERSGLVSMQKRMCLRHVGDIASRAHDGVHQARRSINANVRFHSEVPVIALLRLVHLRITLAILVLCRRRRGDQRGVNNGPFAHHQTFFGQMSVDRIEDLARQFVRLEQVAKLEQGRRVRRRLAAQIDADKSTNGLAVVDRIFDAFVRQTKALLGYVHPQHTCQTDRWTTRAFDLRIERFDQFVQLAPGRNTANLFEKTVAPRELFLGSVFEVGEALLHDRWRAGNVPLLSQVAVLVGTGTGELISASLEHPAVPGLLLSLNQRLGPKLLEIADRQLGKRNETAHEKQFRILWKKPIKSTPSTTAKDFTEMDLSLFRGANR